MTKKRKIIIGTIILVFILIIIFLMRGCRNDHIPDFKETLQSEKRLDFIPANTDNENITIPGVTGLFLSAGNKKQTVDFYNPSENNCYFKISLYLSDDTLIYQSDYIKPSEHITDIELSQVLEKGIYKNSYILYECFTLDDTKKALNSAQVLLELNSQ